MDRLAPVRLRSPGVPARLFLAPLDHRHGHRPSLDLDGAGLFQMAGACRLVAASNRGLSRPVGAHHISCLVDRFPMVNDDV